MKKQHEMTPAEWRTWITSRPPEVQKLIEEFPYGQELKFEDGSFFTIGWSENDEIVVSPINPYADLEESRNNYRTFSAKLIRQHTLVQ